VVGQHGENDEGRHRVRDVVGDETPVWVNDVGPTWVDDAELTMRDVLGRDVGDGLSEMDWVGRDEGRWCRLRGDKGAIHCG
jgi:hypothetical protein